MAHSKLDGDQDITPSGKESRATATGEDVTPSGKSASASTTMLGERQTGVDLPERFQLPEDHLERRLGIGLAISILVNLLLWWLASGFVHHHLVALPQPIEVRLITPAPKVPPKKKPIVHKVKPKSLPKPKAPPKQQFKPPPPTHHEPPPPPVKAPHLMTSGPGKSSGPAVDTGSGGKPGKLPTPAPPPAPTPAPTPPVPTPAPPPVCAAVPDAPGDVSASDTTTTKTVLHWSGVSAPDHCTISGYAIYKDGVKIDTVSGTNYTIDDLSASNQYSFAVAAVDENGTGPKSSVHVATASPPPPPGPTKNADATYKELPEIPDELKSEEYKSKVMVKIDINEDGSFTATLKSSSGNPDIDERVKNALSHWKWKPALKDGKPVHSTQRFEFDFTVQ